MNLFQEIFEKQKAYFNADHTKSLEWRLDQLSRMEKMLSENEVALREAVGKDFKTSFAEQVFEVLGPLAVIDATKKQLEGWMQPEEAHLPTFLSESGHKGIVYREPYGVTLVIAPFNGPLLLAVDPAVTALAAGNTVILKASNALKHTGDLLQNLVAIYFEPECFTVVKGDRESITELLKLPMDFIFFTGSTQVGKVVMRAAAENLTPVLLELGGQNPVIVDETADVSDAAKKAVWGATAWGGQWCTSPGYTYVHESKAEEFVREAQKALAEMYGENPQLSPDYSRIIDVKSVQRLAGLVKGENIIVGGQFDEEERYFAPTIIYPTTWESKIMEDEIFGPILPILTYSDTDELIAKIKSLPKALAGYIFSSNQKNIDRLVHSLSFGGGAVNQVNVHLYIESMPFGGVGTSGIGNYYGKYGFQSLTHAKSILYSPSGQLIDHLIPPYTVEKVQALGQWGIY